MAGSNDKAVEQATQTQAGEHQIALSQFAQSTAINDAMAAAPASATQRILDVTKEGIKDIPQGFIHSLDPRNILPNVGMGFAIGAAAKLLLPEGGPVGAIAGAAMTAYFLGKPLFNSYDMAYHAKTMGDMHNAATVFGDAVGGMPVSMAEGAVGAKLGAGLAGRAMATGAPLQGFAEWKAGQYGKLNNSVVSGMNDVRNFAYDHFGVGSKVVSGPQGIIPPYMLEEIAKRTNNPDMLDTLKQTRALADNQGVAPRAGKGEMHGAREVYDAQGKETQPGVKVRFEGEPATGNAEADNAYDYTGNVRKFYKEVHGRDSIDGKGMKLVSTINYGDNYENAFWNGSQMTYGRPSQASPFKTFILQDVTGHEMTHGVTQFEADTQYYGQPGALNEHFSDVYGELVQQRALGQTADQANWLVGDGIWKDNVKGTALRSMLKPGTAYDDPAIGKDPQPATMSGYKDTWQDNGGVHLNSGIPNRAFATFAQSVGGNAWEDPGHIWYEARAKAGSQPSFAQFAYQTIEAAKSLGHADLVPKLQAAWKTVEVTPSATDTGTSTGFLARSGLGTLLNITDKKKGAA